MVRIIAFVWWVKGGKKEENLLGCDFFLKVDVFSIFVWDG